MFDEIKEKQFVLQLFNLEYSDVQDVVEHQIKCTKKIKLNAKRNNVKFNSIQII